MTVVAIVTIATLAGMVTGLGTSVVWVMLNVPSRLMHVFGVSGTVRSGWALLIGMLFGALMPMLQASLALGDAFGVLAMLLGGIMTGMVASALAEIANVVPHFLCHFDLVRAAPAVCWAMAVGKAAGAFCASYSRLW